MTKAEQATLETLERGLHLYLKTMSKNINTRFDKVEEGQKELDTRLDAHILAAAAPSIAPPPPATPTEQEKIRVLGWAVGKVSLLVGGGGGLTLLVQQLLQYLQGLPG
jgi:hypothetical protein